MIVFNCQVEGKDKDCFTDLGINIHPDKMCIFCFDNINIKLIGGKKYRYCDITVIDKCNCSLKRLFHTKCLNTWFKYNTHRKCPVCKFSEIASDENQENTDSLDFNNYNNLHEHSYDRKNISYCFVLGFNVGCIYGLFVMIITSAIYFIVKYTPKIW